MNTANAVSARHLVAIAGIALLPIAASALVLFDLLANGPFQWHYGRPGVAAGAIEIGLLYGLLLLAWRRFHAYAMVITGVLALLYLRRHHVDLPALAGVLYLEGVIALGGLLAKRFTPVRDEASRWLPEPLAWLLIGLSSWLVLMLVSSIAGYGQPQHLLALAAVVLLPALAVRWRSGLLARAIALQKQASHDYDWLAIAVLVWLLVLIARTNNVVGHDSLWYPLQPEQVLIGARSLFDDLGMVHTAHYTPKGWELLIAPLSVFGDFSFMTVMTVLMLPPMLLAIDAALRERRLPDTARWLGLLLAATVPAVANTALSAKPDVLAGLLASACLLVVMRMAHRRDLAGWPWLLACVVLAMGFRINVMPYLALLLAGALVWAIALRSTRRFDAAASRTDRAGLICLAIATLATLGLTARTWWLTGYPTIGPSQLTALWHWLGFELEPHIGEFEWMFPQRWREVPGAIVDWLFRPTRMEHIIVSWTGNVWLVCGAIALFMRIRWPLRGESAPAWPMWLLLAAGAVLMLAIRYYAYGGDGNYFLPAVALASAWSAAAAWQSLRTRAWQRAFTAALVLTALFQASYAFVSAGWDEPGTQPLDLDFTRSVVDTPQLRQSTLAAAGLSEIGTYLDKGGGRRRGLGFITDDPSFWLRARYESFSLIGTTRPELIKRLDRLEDYMRRYRIDFLLLPADEEKVAWDRVYPDLRPLMERYYGACEHVQDRSAVLVDLRRCS